MITKDYYNDFFEIGQQKINFSFFELCLPDDDPVYTLKKVIDYIGFQSKNKFLSSLTANLADFYIVIGAVLVGIGRIGKKR